MVSSPPRRVLAVLVMTMLLYPVAGFSWGDEGHEIIARIADLYLEPAVRTKVAWLLAGDASGLTRSTDMAAEATWADKFRDSDRNSSQSHYRQTQAWHYIDIELDRPDADAACLRHPALPAGTPASQGPAQDCIVDKIEQFRRELHDTATAPQERRLALQFLLHLIGDLHQPLHAANHHDHGGNDVRVATAGTRAGTLHHYWDTVFVERLGTHADEVAVRLTAAITARQRSAWSSGSPADWARQSFDVARTHAYADLLESEARRRDGGPLLLGERYQAGAEAAVTLQLQRAGVRLARLLNAALRVSRRSIPR
jgi:hypothetical protein